MLPSSRKEIAAVKNGHPAVRMSYVYLHRVTASKTSFVSSLVMPQLVDVFLIHEDLNLVFEFCETDLESILMEQSVILKPEHIKCHMRMLLEGLGYLHDNFVLHRVRALKS